MHARWRARTVDNGDSSQHAQLSGWMDVYKLSLLRPRLLVRVRSSIIQCNTIQYRTHLRRQTLQETLAQWRIKTKSFGNVGSVSNSRWSTGGILRVGTNIMKISHYRQVGIEDTTTCCYSTC